MEDNKITIIEGPPPVFETVQSGWTLGLNEGPNLTDVVMTRLRTFNGPALVERCYRAWNNKTPINLHFRDEMGLEETAPIMAARAVDTEDGQMLLLWLYLDSEKYEFEIDSDDEDLEDFDE